MTIHHPALAAIILAATMGPLGACASGSTGGPADGPSSKTTTTTTGPIDMIDIPAGTPLEPGTYAMPLVGPDSPLRAVVDVPEGYFSAGGWVIDDGHGTLAPDESGDLMFWTDIDQVDADPCGEGGAADVGPTVRDLAKALTAQEHRTTTRPVPVNIGGRQGFYLESRGSQDAASGCLDAQQSLWSDTYGDDWFTVAPDTVLRMWILDVRGQRVVALVVIHPGHTANPAEMAGIAESVRFTDDPS